MKQGARQTKLQENKKVKQHIKAFYSIMGEMESLSQELLRIHTDVTFTEDNIQGYVEPIFGRELDNMEKFLVLGKTHKEDEKDNTE